MNAAERCPGSGKDAIHSDASYTWMCPVCLNRLNVSTISDRTPTVRPHRPGGYRRWAKRVKAART